MPKFLKILVHSPCYSCFSFLCIFGFSSLQRKGLIFHKLRHFTWSADYHSNKFWNLSPGFKRTTLKRSQTSLKKLNWTTCFFKKAFAVACPLRESSLSLLNLCQDRGRIFYLVYQPFWWMRVYYTGSLSHFKCRFAGIFVFIWRFTVQKLFAVSILMQKVKKKKKKKRKRFAV